MKKHFSLFLIFLLMSCQNKNDDLISKSSNQTRKDSIMEQIDKLHQTQLDSFKNFLGVISPDKVVLSESDTIITFEYIFNSAYSGKYNQIVKTDSGVFFTQVYYRTRNVVNGNKKAFQFVNPLINETSPKELYAENFKRYPLEEKKWTKLISEIERSKFFEMHTDSNVEVLDIKSASVNFYSSSKKHHFSGYNLIDEDFYKLCKLIDSYSVDTLDNF